MTSGLGALCPTPCFTAGDSDPLKVMQLDRPEGESLFQPRLMGFPGHACFSYYCRDLVPCWRPWRRGSLWT